MINGEIAKARPDNLMAPVKGSYAGDNRLEVLNFGVMAHFRSLRPTGGIPPYERHRSASEPLVKGSAKAAFGALG